MPAPYHVLGDAGVAETLVVGLGSELPHGGGVGPAAFDGLQRLVVVLGGSVLWWLSAECASQPTALCDVLNGTNGSVFNVRRIPQKRWKGIIYFTILPMRP